jgi:hypothetical protein
VPLLAAKAGAAKIPRGVSANGRRLRLNPLNLNRVMPAKGRRLSDFPLSIAAFPFQFLTVNVFER